MDIESSDCHCYIGSTTKCLYCSSELRRRRNHRLDTLHVGAKPNGSDCLAWRLAEPARGHQDDRLARSSRSGIPCCITRRLTFDSRPQHFAPLSEALRDVGKELLKSLFGASLGQSTHLPEQ
eukprot:494247-Amphidinium_carterae.2